MAIETLIKTGETLLEADEYDQAIEQFSKALSENPKAFKPLLKRAIAFQRSRKLEEALSDINEASKVAIERGNSGLMAEAYFRKSIILFSLEKFPEALNEITLAEKYNSQEASLEIWKKKISAKAGEVQPSKEEKPPQVQLPVKPTYRVDWYQNADFVNISIFAKNIAKDALSVEIHESSLFVTFPTPNSGSYSYNLDPLFEEIVPEKSRFTVFGTKLEIELYKGEKAQWKSLERSDQVSPPQLSYPTSSKPRIDWDHLEVEENNEETADDFFKKLYAGADDDTRRAMMKSFQESNGTALSTNWDNVKKEKQECTPPKGMEAKKW